MTRWLVIGNPENRRVRFFQAALAHCNQPPARVVAYEELLTGRQSLPELARAGDVIRIESPGENFAVEKALLAAGYDEALVEGAPTISPRDLAQLEFDPGCILPSRQWYLGFRHWLRRWHAELAAIGEIHLCGDPAEIEILFDKPRCHALYANAGLPAPAVLEIVDSYDDLRQRMAAVGWTRVFVKLAHGSSASGMVALHVRGERLEAITSAEMVRTSQGLRIYNSLKLRRHTDEDDVRDLINALAAQRVHVEQWLPKASLGHGQVFDLRLVMIDHNPTHCVVRQGRGPLTNLHLGNRRGDLAALEARLGPVGVAALHNTGRAAAVLFPGSLHLALDVLISPNFRHHALLEINAFGDLLPGVLHAGQDTYTTEVSALLRRISEAQD